MSSPSNTQDLTKPHDKRIAAPPARVRKYSEYNSDNDSTSTSTSTERASSKKQKIDTASHGLDGSADLSPQDLAQLLKQEQEEFGYKAAVYDSPGWAVRGYSAASSHTVGRSRSPSVDSWGSSRSEQWPVDMEVDDGDSISSDTTDTTDDSDSTDNSDESTSSYCSTDCDCSTCDDDSTSSNCSTTCDCSTCGDDNTSGNDSTNSDDSDTTDDSNDSEGDNDSQNDNEDDNEDDNDGLDDDSDEEVDLFTEAYRNAINQNRKHER
jgi:hypothetical protein